LGEQSAEPAVLVEARDGKLYIALNRPAALNAQNEEMRDSLVDAIDRFERDDELFVAIVYGVGGRAFSAGADLKEVRAGPGATGPTDRLAPPAHKWTWRHFEAFRWATKPIIAAIDGHCVGGGLELANYCDVRVATEQSQFGQPEPRTIGGAGGPALQQLPRAIPIGEALLMQLTARPMPARRAYEVGLIQRLCPDRETLMAEAETIADQMMEGNPEALRVIKRVVRWGADMSAEQAEKLALFGSEVAERVAGSARP